MATGDWSGVGALARFGGAEERDGERGVRLGNSGPASRMWLGSDTEEWGSGEVDPSERRDGTMRHVNTFCATVRPHCVAMHTHASEHHKTIVSLR